MIMIIIGKKYGQLGTRLFLYAHFIANANDNDNCIFNPAFEEYATYFEGPSKQVFVRYRPPYMASIGKNPRGTRKVEKLLGSLISTISLKFMDILAFIEYNESSFHKILWLDPDDFFHFSDQSFVELVSSHKFIIIAGWRFENGEELKRNRKEICSYFTPIKSLIENIKKIIVEARAGHDILVGVHIRLGDYLNWNEGKYYYNPIIYKKLMNTIINQIPGKRVGFMVCSNERIDPEVWTGLDVVYGTGQLVEDMYSLAECDYIIGPPSTFSMWASFYGKKPLYIVKNPERAFSLDDFKICDDLVPP